MKEVFIVYIEECIDKIFDTQEKAENYIKSNSRADDDRLENELTWEEYLDLDTCEVYMGYTVEKVF